MAQTPPLDWHRKIRLYRIAHLLRFALVEPACEESKPLHEKRAGLGRIVELKWVQPRGCFRPQAVVSAANCADKELRSAVLVEEDGARAIFACLGKEEVEYDRLART